MRVPDVEVAHRGELAHRFAIATGDCEDGRAALCVAEAAVPGGDLEARGEALDIPLERAAQRLVEVVEVEDERPLRRGEAAEVREVRVAAKLDVEPRSRRRREVMRHYGGSAAVHRERRGEHAAVADRDELGDAL